ncbi:biotin--[acetyl-CoA-carboxylase] ligase [Desulfopila sp. IMCC35008]|uniref:biotin--[acetyl-CoA-carboxylase] ligase n=1 Tax=Desulfopila sp. IMCC35008 TaxID=2653858 RepID=UPI0013D17039|nr:biotin--[acetyl-CoA-carboxylase] ligase [Desulfopila sp. IMCC35008]
MKTKILQILKQTGNIISGEELSSQLGVSRVTIWKHIKTLQELGYEISTSSKGYSLSDDNDFLYSWEFPGREALVHYYDSLPSTMDAARKLARKGSPDQSVVIAQSQKKGRGRMQRKWFSKQGGLYFTLILRPPIPAVSGFLVNFITSSVLAETIREETGLKAMVKWPNDILLNDRKLSGMLSEMEAEEEMVTFVNIGIGLNVNNDPAQDEPTATSIARELGHPIHRRSLLINFLDRLAAKLANDNLESAVQQWKQYTMTIGRQVKIVTTKGTTEGKAVDIDESGALLLELQDGTVEKVIYGDCFHL